MKRYCFDHRTYLKRISYDGTIDVTLDCLAALHHAQLYTIPFENFDILLDRGINLEPSAIFNKLVLKKRGGYCFELNGLFLMVLKSIGFDARALLARVHRSGTPSGRGHQISLVTLGGKQWIADVGFGKDTPRAPVLLEINKPTSHDGQKIRFVDAGHFGTMLQLFEENPFEENQWMNLYSFDLGHVFPADIAYGNYFTSTHPGEMFTFARVATLAVPNGGITLLNTTLTTSMEGIDKVQELEEGIAYLDALKKHFGIDLEAPYDRLRPLPDEEVMNSINSA